MSEEKPTVTYKSRQARGRTEYYREVINSQGHRSEFCVGSSNILAALNAAPNADPETQLDQIQETVEENGRKLIKINGKLNTLLGAFHSEFGHFQQPGESESE